MFNSILAILYTFGIIIPLALLFDIEVGSLDGIFLYFLILISLNVDDLK